MYDRRYLGDTTNPHIVPGSVKIGVEINEDDRHHNRLHKCYVLTLGTEV